MQNRHYKKKNTCGIILAAGDGVRLQPFIRRVRGDSLPKQYVRFFGMPSMLEQTYLRAKRVIPTNRIFTVIDEKHLYFAEAQEQLSNCIKENLVLQPENKETGPGILLPLIYLYRKFPDAVVVVFPSDHFILGDEIFLGHVEFGIRLVNRDPSQFIVLGVSPTRPEPDYGYLLSERSEHPESSSEIKKVSQFIEKPGAQKARELIQEGALWNSFIMIFQAKSFIHAVRRLAPPLFTVFNRILTSIGTPWEKKMIQNVYHEIEPLNFSEHLLQKFFLQEVLSLSVLKLRGTFWSDWGSEERILESIKEIKRFYPKKSSYETEVLSPIKMNGTHQPISQNCR